MESVENQSVFILKCYPRAESPLKSFHTSPSLSLRHIIKSSIITSCNQIQKRQRSQTELCRDRGTFMVLWRNFVLNCKIGCQEQYTKKSHPQLLCPFIVLILTLPPIAQLKNKITIPRHLVINCMIKNWYQYSW